MTYELSARSSGSDRPMVIALKRHNGARVSVFVMGALADILGT